MKRIHVVIGLVVLVGGVSVTGATAGTGAKTVAWTESKAELVVARDATVRFPALEKASLESELRAAAARYWILEQYALTEAFDGSAASRFHNLAYRFRRALSQVRSGLAIAEAECSGSVAAAQSGRFTSFRCLVTSEELEIPSVKVVFSEDGKIHEILEGEPRHLDAVQARLDVRVMARSTISYRQLDVQAFLPS